MTLQSPGGGAPKQCDQNKQPKACRGAGRNVLPFALGFGLLLLAGWALWPVFSEQPSSEAFSLEKAAPGQSGSGQSGSAQEVIGTNNSKSVRGEGQQSEDLPFLIMRQQPDHVLFAPVAHSRDLCNQCHNFSEKKYLELFKASPQIAAKQQAPEQPEQELFEQENPGRKEDGRAASLGQKERALLYQPKPLNMQECMSCHAIEAHLKHSTANNSCSTCHK